ncbi:glycosyltransferase N-terminal domain-containing protein [Muricauda sp. MAR_2010_75]|uniref:3-deoxy-D-manno-octulosonic acid transferase n=1 Tax=Allomuricauda sp. MAR_2010_75 TaxID=1250232 RepID=UPI0029342DB6|nr:glycosyltransferase N-terminal domain-containing protein [Muricauda sp. MAR_2010_75]
MMLLRFVYTILIKLSWYGLKVIALFNPKIKLFVLGRKKTFAELEAKLPTGSKSIWMHVASLGEFEQGLPILEKLKTFYPDHKIVLTFFSPSGYEVKKNTPIADAVVYLPMDTPSNAKRFLDKINPELAIFIKYEIWPNYLYQLEHRNIATLLVSARFSKRQIFFKPLGGFMRNSLKAVSHFFVQDERSKTLLESIGHNNATISGDTRFDRVSEILNQDNHLDFVSKFKGDHFCLVAGSTWPEDEKILIDFINSTQHSIKFVIAPHQIKPAHIDDITSAITKKSICFTQWGDENLSQFDVLIVDTIGLLTKIYSYADVAYVGGGFATGLHNTLEPAVFGIPVIIGPNFKGFKEAEDLVAQNGILPVHNQENFNDLVNGFIADPKSVGKTGKINSSYITDNLGATSLVMKHIKQIL